MVPVKTYYYYNNLNECLMFRNHQMYTNLSHHSELSAMNKKYMKTAGSLKNKTGYLSNMANMESATAFYTEITYVSF